METDFDNMAGFWLKGLPYLWVEATTWDKCMRIYIVDLDISAVFDKDDNIMDAKLISTALNFKKISPKETFSLLPLKDCEAVRNYYLIDIYNFDIDNASPEKIKSGIPFKGKVNIRIEGKPVSPDFRDWRLNYEREELSPTTGKYYIYYNMAKVINPRTGYENEFITYPSKFGNPYTNVPFTKNIIWLSEKTSKWNRRLKRREVAWKTRKFTNLAEAAKQLNLTKEELPDIHEQAMNPSKKGNVWAYEWAKKLDDHVFWSHFLFEEIDIHNNVYIEYVFRSSAQKLKTYDNIIEVILDQPSLGIDREYFEILNQKVKSLDEKYFKIWMIEEKETKETLEIRKKTKKLENEVFDLEMTNKKLNAFLNKFFKETEYPPNRKGWIAVEYAMDYLKNLRYHHPLDAIDKKSVESRIILDMLMGNVPTYKVRDPYLKK